MLKKTTIGMLLITGLLVSAGRSAAQMTGTILVPDLRVRSGPGTDYRVLWSLNQGDRVPIKGLDNGWLKIEQRGREGFILKQSDLVALSGTADTAEFEDRDGLKNPDRKAENIGAQLRQAQSDVESTTRKEKAVLAEFNAAEEALNRARQQVRTAQAELTDLEARIAEIEEQSQALEKELRSGEAYAAKRLNALYKLNWVGRIQLLATADSFFDFIHRRGSLQRILARDEDLLEALHNDQVALESLLTELNAKKAEKRSLELTLKDRVGSLSAQQNKRKSLLDKIRSEKSLELAALDALRQAGRDLDAAVARIEPQAPEAPARPENKPGGESFDDYKGLLGWPVRGKIVTFFGPHRDKKYAITKFQSGINIQAERGEPIRAVSDGYTIYSGWFKGFGNMMIIDHGNHYYTVYAHLEEVFKVKGDRVEKNEVIATVGDSGSMLGPALHFEVRHHGKPVDPMEWIRKG